MNSNGSLSFSAALQPRLPHFTGLQGEQMAPRVSAVEPVIPADRQGRQSGAAVLARKLKIAHPEWSESDLAKFIGCDPALVHRALKGLTDIREQAVKDLERYQASKADRFDAMQLRIYESITDRDLRKAQLLPRVTSLAILEDKARTIRGQATSVNVTVLLDAVQTIKQMRRPGAAPQDVVIEGESHVLSGPQMGNGGAESNDNR